MQTSSPSRYGTTTADDLAPLMLGEPAADELLDDFPGLWNLTESPPPKPKPRHYLSGGGGGGESLTQASGETETASSGIIIHQQQHSHRRTASSSVISNQSSEGGDADDASRTSLKRRRTSAGGVIEPSSSASSYPGFQPLPRVPETKNHGDDVRQPYMVEVQDHDVVLGEFFFCLFCTARQSVVVVAVKSHQSIFKSFSCFSTNNQ